MLLSSRFESIKEEEEKEIVNLRKVATMAAMKGAARTPVAFRPCPGRNAILTAEQDQICHALQGSRMLRRPECRLHLVPPQERCRLQPLPHRSLLTECIKLMVSESQVLHKMVNLSLTIANQNTKLTIFGGGLTL